MSATGAEPEIKPGTFVGLKEHDKDKDADALLGRWRRCHGRGPFLVSAQRDNNHVTLKNQEGEIIHFGSTVDPSLNIGFVEPWEPA